MEPNQVHIFERIAVQAAGDSRETVMRGLAYLVGPTRVKAGCLDCNIHQDLNDLNLFCFESQWDSMQAFQRHAQSDLYKTLLHVLEAAPDPPVIEYYEIATTYGLEFLRSVREGEADGSATQGTQRA